MVPRTSPHPCLRVEAPPLNMKKHRRGVLGGPAIGARGQAEWLDHGAERQLKSLLPSCAQDPTPGHQHHYDISVGRAQCRPSANAVPRSGARMWRNDPSGRQGSSTVRPGAPDPPLVGVPADPFGPSDVRSAPPEDPLRLAAPSGWRRPVQPPEDIVAHATIMACQLAAWPYQSPSIPTIC
jgi:hypothetical protein